MDPLVSIIIPVYNGANYMREAINSAINQTYHNIEIIVVNDGSNDGGKTDAIAKSYGNAIRYICKKNGGSSSALNCGISQMKGEYFSWLSHDDIYLPEKIEMQVEAIKKHPNSVIICDSFLIDAEGKRLMTKIANIEGEKTAEEGLSLLVHGHSINGCAVLVPKKVIDEIGSFDENMVYLNDLDYWYRMMLSGVGIVYLKQCLVKNRVHGEQVSVRKIELFEKERQYLVNKNVQNINRVKIEKKYVLEKLAYFCAYEGLFFELKKIGRLLNRTGIEKWAFYVKYGILGIYGICIQFIKQVRRKVVFHR